MNAKEAIAKKEEKLEGLIREAEASPAIISVRAQQKAELLALRQETAGRIEALRNEQAATVPKLRDALATAQADHAKAKAALEGLADGCRIATLALMSESQFFDTTIRTAEASLIGTADPLIDETVQFFLGKLDWLRSPGRISRNAAGSERNLFTWVKTVREESNVDAIRVAVRYCQDAVAELEGMKLCPALSAGRIAELKNGLPLIDEYQERQATIPLAKGPMPMPRAAQEAEDAHQKTVIDRLIAKANVLLSKPSPPKPAPKLGKRTYQRINNRMVDIGPAKD